jgi:hypothetical protein
LGFLEKDEKIASIYVVDQVLFKFLKLKRCEAP